MPVLASATSQLILIDLQVRLVPAIHAGDRMVAHASRLVAAANLFGVPVTATEQYPAGLGRTVPQIDVSGASVLEKMTFDSGSAPGFADLLSPDRTLVVGGCEAHVCVLQTVLGLLAAGRRVAVVADAVGSRHPANHEAALERMARHGADVVTTEMVIFEWLGAATHPAFKAAMALVK